LSQLIPEVQNGAVPNRFFLITDHWANSSAICWNLQVQIDQSYLLVGWCDKRQEHSNGLDS